MSVTVMVVCMVVNDVCDSIGAVNGNVVVVYMCVVVHVVVVLPLVVLACACAVVLVVVVVVVDNVIVVTCVLKQCSSPARRRHSRHTAAASSQMPRPPTKEIGRPGPPRALAPPCARLVAPASSSATTWQTSLAGVIQFTALAAKDCLGGPGSAFVANFVLLSIPYRS